MEMVCTSQRLPNAIALDISSVLMELLGMGNMEVIIILLSAITAVLSFISIPAATKVIAERDHVFVWQGALLLPRRPTRRPTRGVFLLLRRRPVVRSILVGFRGEVAIEYTSIHAQLCIE